MKECFKCHKTKYLDDFYKHPRMADGHLNKCKECTKQDIKKSVFRNREYYAAYDKARNRTPERKAWKRAKTAEWRKDNPLAHSAHKAVQNALAKGILKKGLCHCDSNKVEAHHPDYNRPLFVIWLCNKHHKHIHNRTAH